MDVFEIIVGIILVLAAIFLVVVVLLQDSKSDGLSGALAGSGDTYWNRSKGKSKDALKNKLTLIVAIFFIVVTLVLYVWQPWSKNIDYGKIDTSVDTTTTTQNTATTQTPVTTQTTATTAAPVTQASATQAN